MYATPDGESHFEDIEVAMRDAHSAAFAMNVGRSDPIAVATMRFGCNPALDTDQRGVWQPWHPEARRQFVVRLQGELEVQVSDGDVRRLGPGSVMLAEDTTGRGHRARLLSDGESQALYIPLAE